MTLDTYHIYYHVESSAYLDEHYKLTSSWELARRFKPEELLPKWTGLLLHHPLRNLERSIIETRLTTHSS